MIKYNVYLNDEIIGKYEMLVPIKGTSISIPYVNKSKNLVFRIPVRTRIVTLDVINTHLEICLDASFLNSHKLEILKTKLT